MAAVHLRGAWQAWLGALASGTTAVLLTLLYLDVRRLVRSSFYRRGEQAESRAHLTARYVIEVRTKKARKGGSLAHWRAREDMCWTGLNGATTPWTPEACVSNQFQSVWAEAENLLHGDEMPPGGHVHLTRESDAWSTSEGREALARAGGLTEWGTGDVETLGACFAAAVRHEELVRVLVSLLEVERTWWVSPRVRRPGLYGVGVYERVGALLLELEDIDGGIEMAAQCADTVLSLVLERTRALRTGLGPYDGLAEYVRDTGSRRLLRAVRGLLA
jgi:hypothetical protein